MTSNELTVQHLDQKVEAANAFLSEALYSGKEHLLFVHFWRVLADNSTNKEPFKRIKPDGKVIQYNLEPNGLPFTAYIFLLFLDHFCKKLLAAFVVTSDVRGPRFESSRWQTKKKKRSWTAHFKICILLTRASFFAAVALTRDLSLAGTSAVSVEQCPTTLLYSMELLTLWVESIGTASVQLSSKFGYHRIVAIIVCHGLMTIIFRLTKRVSLSLYLTLSLY